VWQPRRAARSKRPNTPTPSDGSKTNGAEIQPDTRTRTNLLILVKGMLAVQCSAVQCSAVQCSAVQCSAVQCSAVQISTQKGGRQAASTAHSRLFCKYDCTVTGIVQSLSQCMRETLTRCGPSAETCDEAKKAFSMITPSAH
jgi:hypothetical protein